MLFQLTKKLLGKTDGSDLNQYLAVFSAALSFFSAGIHFGWPLPSLPKLLASETYNISEDEASNIAIISSVGHVIGGFTGSYLIDKIGRKYTVLSLALPQTLGFLLIYISTVGKYWLYAARIAGGIAEGATMIVVPTYVSEVTGPELRGTCGTITGMFVPVGCIFVVIVGSYIDIPVTALICLIFPILFFITFILMPESPYYLLMKNQTIEAENSLKILRRAAKVEKELFSLTVDVDRQMSERGTYKDLFTIPSNRKAFLLMVFIRSFQQFSGISAINTYSQLLISQSTNFSPIVGSIILQCLGFVMYIPTYFLIDRFGRRFLLRISVIFLFISLTLLGTFFLLQDFFSLNMSAISWAPLVLLCAFIASFGLGSSIVVTVFIAEIFSSSIKSKALGLGSIVFAGTMMCSIKFYQYTADNISMAVPFYCFAIITFFSVIFSFKFLPETKGKTLEMIQHELRKDKLSVNI